MSEHRGLRYTIERVEKEQGGYKYGFVLFVEGHGRVMTATELERRGFRGPEDGGQNWTEQLEKFAVGYIDGLEASE